MINSMSHATPNVDTCVLSLSLHRIVRDTEIKPCPNIYRYLYNSFGGRAMTTMTLATWHVIKQWRSRVTNLDLEFCNARVCLCISLL